MSKGKLGPHQGKELELLLSGKKPIAMIEPCRWREFSKYVENGVLNTMPIAVLRSRISKRRGTDILYFLPGEEWRAAMLQTIYNNIVNEDRLMTTEDHTTIGKLLGYSDADIKTFLDAKNA